MSIMRMLTVAGFVASLSGFAWAAASQQPFQGTATVDPQMKDATPYVLSLKVFDQCMTVQSRLMETTREAVHTPCSCYAKATIGGMSKDELDFLRNNGHFGDSVRPKALANIDRCKLKRPPGA